MKNLTTRLTFTAPIGAPAHRQAEQFRRYHSNPQKAKQVYLNTLAVFAVNFYLQGLGFETSWDSSDSRDPIMQALADVADLEVENLGKLECRPVLPNASVVEIPAEVWSDRIGYIAVQFNQSLTEATLLGFVKEVETEELPLSEWRSLDELLDHLESLRQPPVTLSHWLQNVVDASWQTVEALLGWQQVQPAFRNMQPLDAKELKNTDRVRLGKLLKLERAEEKIALLVAVTPEEAEMKIWVEVYPTSEQTFLPQNLQLMVLDEQGEAVMQAQARSTKSIQLDFKGEPGERFSVKVALGDFSITEAFII